MATTYANLVDPQLLNNNIDADYTNEARLVKSAIVSVEDVPNESSQLGFVKNKMFAGVSAQAVGVATDLTISSKVQSEFQFPIVKRGNIGELDGTFEQIRKKAARYSWTDREVQENISNSLTDALMTNAGQGLDDVGMSVVNGVAEYCKTNTYNYLDKSASAFTLKMLSQTMALRGEGGTRFSESGFLMLDGEMYQALVQEGLVDFSNNTVGGRKQDEIVSSGFTGTILGMRPFITDKITAPDLDDKKLVLIEQGALRMLASPIDVRAPYERELSDSFSQKYFFRAGGIIDGFSWSAAKAALVTDANLATGTNYEVYAESNKNVPFAVLEVDKPA